MGNRRWCLRKFQLASRVIDFPGLGAVLLFGSPKGNGGGDDIALLWLVGGGIGGDFAGGGVGNGAEGPVIVVHLIGKRI